MRTIVTAAFTVVTAVTLSACGGSSRPVPAVAAASRSRPAETAASARDASVTTVATVLTTSPRYSSPGHREPGIVPASWYDYPSVLPVLATRPGWVRVRLAQRPAGSTAWIPSGDVTLGSTPYRIVIDLATTHLMLYKDGREILDAPAGVGTPDDPTPAGHYFAAFTEPSLGPGYGPFIIVTSDHSDSIADWEGSGDAVIGIHGPLGESAAIGATGARISHGCIRLQLPDLARLQPVSPGTPIDVIG
jgi:lipoprotein-anchoring transpeptidase ErfK/SrfK